MSEIIINKKQKTEIDNIINIIHNYKKDDDINILSKTYEDLQNYIKDKDINTICTISCYCSCLKAVINTVDIINNNKKVNFKKAIVKGCIILEILSKHKNISNLEVMPEFINCIYSVIQKNNTKNNTNKEVLNHTIKTLLNFETIKDYDYIIISRIQIIIDIVKKNIILNNENKTIVLNSCMVIENNYKINKMKEYAFLCLETFIEILKANPNDEEIQEFLSDMIIKIISFNTTFNHNCIIINNGIDIFIANIKKYKNNLNIYAYSCKLLNFLLVIPSDNAKYEDKNIHNIFKDIITQMIKLDCIELLSDPKKMSYNTLLLIQKFCSSEENYIRILNAGYINTILQNIEKINKNENRVLVSLNFIRYIYMYDIKVLNKQFITLQPSDIKIIISIMKLHINNVNIMIESNRILYRYNRLPIINDINDMSESSITDTDIYTDTEVVTITDIKTKVFMTNTEIATETKIDTKNKTLNNNHLKVSLLKDIKIRKYRFETIYNKSQAFIDIGSFDVFFEAIEKNKNNIEILTTCYSVLSHYIFCNGKIAIDEFVNKGGIKIVIESLKTNIKNENKYRHIRRFTLLILVLICSNPDTPYLTNSNKEYQLIIFNSGCIQLAMKTLHIDTTNNFCMEVNAAISLLVAITNDNYKSVTNIIEDGGLKVLLETIKTINKKNILLSQRVFLAHRVCYLFANILIANINGNDSIEFAKENGIELVIEMMKEFINDIGLSNPLKVLYYISKNDELLISIITAMGKVGSFKFLLEFIKIRIEDKFNENVHEYASEILNNLAKDDIILKKMKNDQVLEWIKTNITSETSNKYSKVVNKLKI